MIQGPKKKPTRSLRWILALWFLTFAIVPVVFLTYYSLQKFQQTIDNELIQRLSGNASEIGVILGDFQKALSQQQLQLKRDPRLADLTQNRQKRSLEDYLEEILPASPATTLSVYDEDGDLLAERSKTKSSMGELENPDKKKHISLHEKIRGDLAKKSLLWITDYSIPQTLNLALISPVSEGGNTGYLKMSLELDAVFLKKLSDRMQIQTILIEPNGRIVCGSHPDFKLYKPDFFVDLIRIPKLKAFSLTLRGDPFGFVFSKIPWGSTEFPMALAASKKESNAALENLRVAYYSLLGIMFAVLALSVVAASNVVLRPLSELVEAIQDLHLGENIIELPIKSDNEIGQLTTSFNDLSRRILDAQRALKSKINELEAANLHLKETQSQLVHSAKMASLGQLVAGVAHELNNPIGFIYSNMAHLRDYSEKLIALIDASTDSPRQQQLETLKKDYDLDYIRQDLPKLIRSCEDGARRTKEIVIGLRNFSRAEEQSHGPVDIHEMLDNTLNLLNSEFKNRIEVKKQFGQIPAVVCNQTQINQVFMNMLSNAAQAIEGKGIVWITTRPLAASEGESERVSISIQDTGPGVPPDVLQKIFDPFFTTKRVGQGTGLGLAISYGIVRAHGGSINVTSKVGTGSEFTVILPTRPPPQSPPLGNS